MITRFIRHPLGAIGLVLVAIPTLAALLSLVWTPYDPAAFDPINRWLPPSPEHLLGTDAGGRDLFSILLAGAQSTMTATVLATAIAVAVGLPLAMATALAGRRLGAALERAIDVAIAFPTLVLAIILVTSYGASLWASSVAIGLGGAVVIARTMVPELCGALAADYVTLASSGGVGTLGILSRHVLPNVAPTLLIRATQLLAAAALAEAGLSYLGFGTPAPTPSWGRTLADLQSQVLVRPEVLIAPSLAITTLVIGFALLGDALRDALEPGQRSRPVTRAQRRHAASVPDTVSAPDTEKVTA
ncbi:ABC transporter permease [Microbacterium sp. A93]|uniref:ABC transporter permease n=1 Tax=Microbacterium sp. A93 TaxID=3450716 RepID=UPI003F42B32A